MSQSLSPESQKFVDDFINSSKQGAHSAGPAVVHDTSNAAGAKEAGNAAYKAGRFLEAVDLYSQALRLCSDESQRKMYYSNRAAAYQGQKMFIEARQDAEKCVALDPTWEKGWYRKGLAEEGLELYREAEVSFRKGVECAPRDAALNKALQEVKMML